MRYLHSKWLYKQAMQRTCSQMQAAATSLNRRHTEPDQTVRANRLGFQFFKRLSWLAKCYRTDEQHRRSKVCFAVWSALGCRRNGRIVCSIVCTSYSQFIFMPLDKWQCIFTMARGICVRFGSFFFFFRCCCCKIKMNTFTPSKPVAHIRVQAAVKTPIRL